jgi:hypothetical protein
LGFPLCPPGDEPAAGLRVGNSPDALPPGLRVEPEPFR